MAEGPPRPMVIDLVNGDSDFAMNGFAALNNQPEAKDQHNSSDESDRPFSRHNNLTIGKSPYFSTLIKQEKAEGDDGDFMILDKSEVPAHLTAKFAVRSWRARTPDLEITGVKIKQEVEVADAMMQAATLQEDKPEHEIKDENRSDDGSLFGDDQVIGDDQGPTAAPTETAAHQNEDDDDDEAMFVDEFDEPINGDDSMEIENILDNVFQDPGGMRLNANGAEVPVAHPLAGHLTTDNPPSSKTPTGNTTADITPEDTAPRSGYNPLDPTVMLDADQAYGGNNFFGAGDPLDADDHLHADTRQRLETPSAVFLASHAEPTGSNAYAGMPGSSGEAGVDIGAASASNEDNGIHDDDNGIGNIDHGNVDIHGDDIDGNFDLDRDDDFVIGDDHELSDGEQPRPRRRKANRKKKPTADSGRSETLEPAEGGGANGHAHIGAELDLEDLEDELKLLEAEFDLFTRRKEKGKFGPNDKDRLDNITLDIEKLKSLIHRAQPTAQARAEEGLRKMLEEEPEDSGDENGQAGRSKRKRHATRIPAIARRPNGLPSASNSQKRKSTLGTTSSKSRSKKQKTGGRGKKVNISKTTAVLLEMATSNDPIAARAQMDDMQVFKSFKASTVKEQIQQLKEQIRADPAADQRRISADLKLLEGARRAFGRKFCKPKDGQWLITGMTKLLHHYQLVGAGWMLNREVRREPPFGGILADSVGLGKTIEAIACIAGNPMSEEDRAEGKFGTLIVVPSNLLGQWQDEINACCPDITVAHYHSSKTNRVKMSNIRKVDIVVTTYYEVAKGFPHRDKLKLMENVEESEMTDKFNEALGELFTVEWHRIILDEAHAIKNGNTHTSKACINLRGKYRWCLTATPLHNGLYEILPYMQFVGAVEADPIANPNDKKSRRPRVTGEEINDFLRDCMMSRQLKNLFLGKALFEIPMAHPQPNVWISLSEEEFLIYKRIEEIIRRRINKAQAMPGLMKKRATASFFSLAIRLRQAVSHPFTLFYLMRDVYELSDIKDIRKQMREIKRDNPNRRFIDQVGSWCEKQLANGRIEGTVLRTDNMPEDFGKGDHGIEFNMDPQLAKMEKLKSGHGGICSICGEPPVAQRKTRCNHVFCRDCIEGVIETEKAEGSEKINCPVCNKEYGLNEMIGSQRKKRAGGAVNPEMPGSDYSGLQPLGDEESAEFLAECDRNPRLAMAPSAKTVMVKDIILKWQNIAPDDKVIVFTQWVVVGRVLGRMLQQENIKFVYFFGEMTREEKEANINVFHTCEEAKVMIASLKCGGQGLNLTCANRVILVDPWWNSALEHQGYGRVFRMGQTKETWFVRLLTRKTIDGRMAKLQAKKLKEINGAIKDFDSTRASLNFEEVAELFGRVTRDEDGNMIGVESDYDTDEEDEVEDGLGGGFNDMPDFGTADNFSEPGQGGLAGNGDQGLNGEYGNAGFTYGDSQLNGFGIQDLIP